MGQCRATGLLVLGTYLMEQHHSTNLNRLTRPMGVDFSLDIITPRIKGRLTGRSGRMRNYRNSVITTQPVGSPDGATLYCKAFKRYLSNPLYLSTKGEDPASCGYDGGKV